MRRLKISSDTDFCVCLFCFQNSESEEFLLTDRIDDDNDNDSTDDEVDNEDEIVDSDTEKDPIVFPSDDDEDEELEFESESEEDDNNEDEAESEEEDSDEENTDSDNSGEDLLDSENGDSEKEIREPKTQNKLLIKSRKENKDNVRANEKANNEIENIKNVKRITKNVSKTIVKNSADSTVEPESRNELVKADEYENDSSDEEDIRNTVGNIPMQWYDEYPHIGYDWDGKRILKPEKGDQLDNFLKRMEDPDFWRTVKDPLTGQDVVLSEADIDLITRIQKQKIPDAQFDEYAVSIKTYDNIFTFQSSWGFVIIKSLNVISCTKSICSSEF